MASIGGGVAGYSASYLTIGVVALILTVLAFGQKPRAVELATMAVKEEAVRVA